MKRPAITRIKAPRWNAEEALWEDWRKGKRQRRELFDTLGLMMRIIWSMFTLMAFIFTSFAPQYSVKWQVFWGFCVVFNSLEAGFEMVVRRLDKR